jgi:flagellar hook-associated protein 2
MGLRSPGTITFGGIASGIPTGQIIEQLLALERRPIDQLEQRRDGFEERLKVFQDLAAKTRALRDAVRQIDDMNTLGTAPSAFPEFDRFSARSSDESAVSATASPSAAPGSLRVLPSQRAAATRLVSQGYAALTDPVGQGTIVLTVGATAPTVTTITLDGSNDSVEGLVAAINDSGAAVRAFVLDDGDAAAPLRIVVQGEQTGEERAASASVSLSGGTAPSLVQTQAAQDALLVLDPEGGSPITLRSGTNEFSNVMPGLTLTLESPSAAAVSVDVERDSTAMGDRVLGLVELYNQIMGVIDQQFEIDPATQRGGPLIGDSTLVGLKQRLQLAFSTQLGAGSITSANQIGLELDRQGRLSFDRAEFEAALASSPDDVRGFFSGVDSFADRLARATAAAVDPVDGALTARISGVTRQMRDIDEQIREAEARLDGVEESLVRQFSALEGRVSAIQQQGSFLTQYLLQTVR